MVEWKFGDGPININELFKSVRRGEGDELIIHLKDGNVINIDNYYKKAHPERGDGGIDYSRDTPKTVYTEKQIGIIIDQSDEIMDKKYKEYSSVLREPLLSRIVSLERYAMVLDKIGMKYDAAFNYQYIADDLLCARAGVKIAMEFTDRAKELNAQWKLDNYGGRTDVDGMVSYLKRAFTILSLADAQELCRIDQVLRGYDKFKVYPKEIRINDLATGKTRTTSDKDEIKLQYDKFFDSLIVEEYIAMAEESAARTRGDEKLFLESIKGHVECCLQFFRLGTLGIKDTMVPAHYIEMSREVFKNAESAFEDWKPSPQAKEEGYHASLRKVLDQVRNAIYGYDGGGGV